MMVPNKQMIQNSIKNYRSDLKLSDLEILRNHKNLRNENWMRKIIMSDAHVSAIFASDAMLTRLKTKPMQLFFDGYFKTPKMFQQLLTVYAYDDSLDYFGPIFFVLTNSKEEDNYTTIFTELQSEITRIEEESKLNLHFEASYYLSDFETPLLNAIATKFKGIQKGCFFHWIQALWRASSKHGMKKKTDISTTREIIMPLSLL